MTVRIGLDVGGTNTDAVVLDDQQVLATVKRPTTADVTSGIVDALSALAAESRAVGAARAVMIGTTHFTNAIVEAKRLAPTACLRLGLPATPAVPPMPEWPEALRAAVGEHHYLCHGGHEFDGREISPLDESEIADAVGRMTFGGVRAVAVSSVFSPVNTDMEQRAAELINRYNPELAVSLSHEIGRIGLIERENATIINASLVELAERTIDAFHEALARTGLADVPVYLSQNDGTVMDTSYARRYPVATFASGPTNSMRGAAWLSGLSDCAVVDIGGTTSDVGIIVNGYPRPAGVEVPVGGVRTNFRMPDVLAHGLGGGSRVRTSPSGITVGPDSVGYRLVSDARIFGGDTLTASDLAVAAGIADFGDAGAVADLDPDLIRYGIDHIAGAIATAVDRMRTSPDPIPVVLVGGGAAIVDALPGFDTVIRPPHFEVANAIGAAIAQVGGEVDRVYSLASLTRNEVLAHAQAEATDKAVAAGARADTIRIVESDLIPMAYLPGDATRVRMKAVGDLSMIGTR